MYRDDISSRIVEELLAGDPGWHAHALRTASAHINPGDPVAVADAFGTWVDGWADAILAANPDANAETVAGAVRSWQVAQAEQAQRRAQAESFTRSQRVIAGGVAKGAELGVGVKERAAALGADAGERARGRAIKAGAGMRRRLADAREAAAAGVARAKDGPGM